MAVWNRTTRRTNKSKEDAEDRSIGSANQKCLQKTDPSYQPIRSCQKIRPDSVPSKGYVWTRQRCSVWSLSKGIWLDKRGIWSVWRCVRLVESCQTDMIGRDGNCSYLLETSDWLVRWICLQETLLIGWSDGSVFSVFFWIFCSSCCAISYSHSRLTRNGYAKASSLGGEYAVLICRWSVKQTKRPSPLFTYSTRGGVTLLCTMPMMWLSKCVHVVIVVNIMIHS